MSDLVQRLAKGDHDVEVSLRPEQNVDEFKKRIDDGYVHIKFLGTKGGTELGVMLDRSECDLTAADFNASAGEVRLAGTLTLDYVPVKCHAVISLPTLTGKGHLELVH
jgi:hypothetical protein